MGRRTNTGKRLQNQNAKNTKTTNHKQRDNTTNDTPTDHENQNIQNNVQKETQNITQTETQNKENETVETNTKDIQDKEPGLWKTLGWIEKIAPGPINTRTTNDPEINKWQCEINNCAKQGQTEANMAKHIARARKEYSIRINRKTHRMPAM